MANRYWVGGSGTWNLTNTANWSATSGGAGGASAPTSADSVFFNQAATYTVTVSSARCLSLTNTTGAVSFGGTGGVAVYGSFSLVSTATWSSSLSITFASTSTGNTINTGTNALGAVTFDGVGGGWALSANATCLGTVILTNGALDLNNFTLSCGASGSFTGAFSSNNSNTRSIAFGTTGTIAIYSPVSTRPTAFNTDTSTNLTITGQRTVSVSGAGVSGQATYGFTVLAGRLPEGSGFIVTVANQVTSNSFQVTIYGDFDEVYAATNGVTFIGGCTTYSSFVGTVSSFSLVMAATSGTKIINPIGTLASLTLNGVGGTFRMGKAVAVSGATTLTNGTFDTAGYTLTTGTFSSSNSNTRALTLGASTVVITGASFDCTTSTGLTITAGTSTISMTSASAKSFAGGGKTWNILSNAGAGALTVSGSNTFTTISNSVQPTTFTFTSGTTQTVTNFTVSGTAGNLVTINSTSSGSAAVLSKASGTVNSNYLSIKDSTATGGATWDAGASVDSGNNSGWIFTPRGGGNFFAFF